MLREEPRTSKAGYSSQYETNMKTLTILQKAIIKEDDMFEAEDNLFELQANRLPIIRKRDTRRKQFTVALERKVAVDSPPKREAVREQIAKKSEQLKLVLARRKEEKAEIRGWDIPEEM